MPIVREGKFYDLAAAKRFVEKKLKNIKTVKQWFEYISTDKRHPKLPYNPASFYKEAGWPEKHGWGWFLGTDAIANKEKEFLTYQQAHEFCVKFTIRNREDYKKFVEENRVKDLPLAPEKYYPKTENIKFSWLKFLAPKFCSPEEIIGELARENIENYVGWQKYSKQRRPKYIPSNPFVYYGITFNQLMTMIDKYKAENPELFKDEKANK